MNPAPIADADARLSIFLDNVAQALQTLRDSGNIPDYHIPSTSTALDIIRDSVSTRGGRLRWLRGPRKTSDDITRGFQALRRWHAGDTSGHLAGLFSARFMLRDEYDRMDTLAQVVQILSTGSSAGLDRWRKAIHG